MSLFKFIIDVFNGFLTIYGQFTLYCDRYITNLPICNLPIGKYLYLWFGLNFCKINGINYNYIYDNNNINNVYFM